MPTPNSSSVSLDSKPPAVEQIVELLPSIRIEETPIKPQPYVCLGFAIENSICWISDVSFVPDETWKALEPRIEKGFAVLVVDCLGWKWHTSHFGIKESVETASRVGASANYLIGFGHEIPHDDWVKICKYASGIPEPAMKSENYRVQKAILQIDDAEKAIYKKPHMTPSYDGLRLHINGKSVSETPL